MSWFDDIMDDPVMVLDYPSSGAGLTYSQIRIFRGLLLVYLITRRNMPREVALVIVGMWATYHFNIWHRFRRFTRELRVIGGAGPGWPGPATGPSRFYGPGW